MNDKDQLARGAKSAMFFPPQVSQKKWDTIFKDYCSEDICPKEEIKEEKISNEQ